MKKNDRISTDMWLKIACLSLQTNVFFGQYFVNLNINYKYLYKICCKLGFYFRSNVFLYWPLSFLDELELTEVSEWSHIINKYLLTK